MNPIAVVFKINNGFLIVDPNNEESGSYFVRDFDPAKIAKAEVNHEAAIRTIINSFPAEGGKISAIKAVREYCTNNNYDKYIGLKDAKDKVEHDRSDWHYRSDSAGDIPWRR